MFMSTNITGENYRDRFGFAMTVLDVNLDGIDDLVVAAPGYSGFNVSTPEVASPYPNSESPTFHLFGKVYILYGSVHPFPSSSINDFNGTTLTTLTTTTQLRGLGHTLGTGDLNHDGYDDLLVGCPLDAHGQGHLFGFVSKKDFHSIHTVDVDVEGKADLSLAAPMQPEENNVMSWFGYSATTVGQVLLVGAPFYKLPNTTQVVGCVHAYKLLHPMAMATPFLTLVGEEHLEQFGYAMDKLVLSQTIAISAPDAGSGQTSTLLSKWPPRSGRVSILKNSFFSTTGGVGGGETTRKSILDVPSVATVRGSVPYGRFGTTLLARTVVNSSTDVLLVGAPFQDQNILAFDGREMGCLFVANGNRLVGNMTSDAVDFASYIGKRPRSRFGSSFEVLEQSKATNGSLRVVVGSPLAEVDTMERAGVVDVVDMEVPFIES